MDYTTGRIFFSINNEGKVWRPSVSLVDGNLHPCPLGGINVGAKFNMVRKCEKWVHVVASCSTFLFVK